MRVTKCVVLVAILAVSACFPAASQARAQNQEVLAPTQSEAKATQILQQAITALGGDAYLNVQDVTCTGRMTSFDHSGDLAVSRISSLTRSLRKKRARKICPSATSSTYSTGTRAGNSIAAALLKRRPMTLPSSRIMFKRISTIFFVTEFTSRA